MANIQLLGSLESLQTDINFYLRLVSTADIKSVDAYKKQLYKEFKTEDARQNAYSSKLEESKDIEYDEEIQLEEGSIELDDTEYTEEIEPESVDCSDENTEGRNDYLEESEVVEYTNKSESEEGKEYVCHGVYIDDIDNYTSHGVYVEDIEGFSTEKEEEDYLEDEGYYEEEYSEDEGYSDEYYEEEVSEEYLEESCEEESYEELEVEDEGYEESERGYYEEENNEEFIEEDTEEQDLVVSNIIEDVPQDIRAFLKKYPNSEISFVLKYYSSKEVNKQLMLGRIFKRKGKLCI